MTSVLCFTIRYLDPVPRFHGRGGDGDPEWPPSPLRLFQALVSAAATRWRDDQFRDYAQPALHWLERQSPSIIAPQVADQSFGYRMYVPNNSGDLMTAAWDRGDTETSMAKFRVEKDVRPTHLSGEAVHYLYPLPEGGCPHEEVLKAAARSVTHLGWGVDMVAGDAKVISQEEADQLPGHRWRRVESGGTPLRVPKEGTLKNLMEKHAAFLGRLSADGFKPVPPLSCFNVVRYHSPTAGGGSSPVRPVAAFQLLAPDASRVISFPTARRTRDVAAWVRNATAGVCVGWPFGDVVGFVHGHDPADSNKPLKGELADTRFSYLPLPTINHALNRVEAIRRVLIAAPPGFQDRVDWVRRRLPGQELMQEGSPPEPVGMLNLLPTSDWVLSQYTGEAEVWSTVTPVLLPGYDDRDPAKAEDLLRVAFGHAGLPPEVVTAAALEWRHVGFRAGVDLVSRYERPNNLKKFPAYHVRVAFPRAVRGPVAVGAGRYRGFGLFARE